MTYSSSNVEGDIEIFKPAWYLSNKPKEGQFKQGLFESFLNLKNVSYDYPSLFSPFGSISVLSRFSLHFVSLETIFGRDNVDMFQLKKENFA